MAFLFQCMRLLSFLAVTWFNTFIDIPVFDDLNQYLEIPYAVVEDSGFEIEADYYQRTGVSFTYVTTINTSIVKTYTLYYEAYFSFYDLKSTQKITFNVYDDVEPVITRIPAFDMAIDGDPPNLLTGFTYEDNYDDMVDLNVFIDDSLVNFDQIGTYQIIYRVSDTSYNEVIGIGTLKISDRTNPTIHLIEPIVIERMHAFYPYDYIEVFDNYDVSPIIEIDNEDIDVTSVGTYTMIVKAADHSGNQTEMTFTVTVVDTTPPVIRLVSNPEPIDVFDQNVLNQLDQYIINVFDDDIEIAISQVMMTHDIQIDRLGSYQITYAARDMYGNISTKLLTVKVVDRVAPTIELVSELVFPVFGPDQFLNTYFQIEDNYDDYAVLIIDIDASVKYNQVGLYPIVVSVKDLSKNIGIFEGFVEIVDDISPVINQLSDIIITDFTKHILNSYFSVTDNYDESSLIVIEVDDQMVNYQVVGIYQIHVISYDTSGNETSFLTDLFIMDITPPVLELYQTSLTIEVGSNAVNLASNIKSVSDNYNELTVDDVVILDELNLNEVGIYSVIYELKDAAENMALAILKITVDDFTAPVILLSNLTINQYETCDLMAGVKVVEMVSSYTVKTFPESVDTSQPGELVVTYIVQDDRGNYATVKRTITIQEVTNDYVIEDFIPIISIVLTSVIILFALKKRG